MRHLATRSAALFLGGLLLLGVGCGGSEGESGSYSELLRFVPNQPGYRHSIMVVDYAALRALPASADAADGQSEVERLWDAAEPYVALSPLGIAPIEEYLAVVAGNWELGFGLELADIDRALSAGPQTLEGPDGFSKLELLAGRFDADAVPGRLEECAECAPHEPGEHAGQSYFSWEERTSGLRRLQPPFYDDLGRGGHIAFTDEYVVHANVRDQFIEILDVSQGGGSVLEDAGFELLAKTLDELMLIAVFMGDQPGLPVDFPLDDDAPRLRPYLLYAVGVGVDDDAEFTSIVLVHKSDAEAEANVERLGHNLEMTSSATDGRWPEVFSSWEISSDGRVLTATLQGAARFDVLRWTETPLLLQE